MFHNPYQKFYKTDASYCLRRRKVGGTTLELEDIYLMLRHKKYFLYCVFNCNRGFFIGAMGAII